QNNTLLDPQLWDLSLNFNFYTTTLGKDYGATVSATGNGQAVLPSAFECPLIPNDPADSNFGGPPFYDYNLYSLAPVSANNPAQFPVLSGGYNTIYPVNDDVGQSNCPTGNEPTCKQYANNRHDFYLATFESGVFNTPVCITHTVANLKTGSLN